MGRRSAELDVSRLRRAQGRLRIGRVLVKKHETIGGRMRILHTMLRVGDLQRSIGFYTGVLGMTVLRTSDRPEQKYTLAVAAVAAASPDNPRNVGLNAGT